MLCCMDILASMSHSACQWNKSLVCAARILWRYRSMRCVHMFCLCFRYIRCSRHQIAQFFRSFYIFVSIQTINKIDKSHTPNSQPESEMNQRKETKNTQNKEEKLFLCVSVWMRQNEMLTNRLTCSTNRFQLMGKRQNEMCKAVVSFVTDGRALYVYSSSASIRLSFSLTHTRCLPCLCVSACICVLCMLVLYGSGERVYVCEREESFLAQRLICIVESLWLTDTYVHRTT